MNQCKVSLCCGFPRLLQLLIYLLLWVFRDLAWQPLKMRQGVV